MFTRLILFTLMLLFLGVCTNYRSRKESTRFGYRGWKVQPLVLPEVLNDQIVKTIDPCGDGKGVDDILYLLKDGRIYGRGKKIKNKAFSEGILSPDQYTTMDYQECKFEITKDYKVLWKK